MSKVSPFSELDLIVTARLHLRAPSTMDRQEIFFMRTDLEVNRFIKRIPPKSLEEVDLFINDRLQDRETNSAIYWVLALKEAPRHCIGAISLWQFSDDRKTAEVGYDLHPEYQGKGYMSEALTVMLSFGYEILRLHKIEAYTHIANTSSRSLLERHAFTLTDKKDAGLPSNVVYECMNPNL